MSKDFKSGLYRKQIVSINNKELNYESFLPEPINKEYFWNDHRIDKLLEEASREIGELNAYLAFIPDPDFFIHMHINKEAVSSNKIEGTQTNIEELVTPIEELNEEKKDDYQETVNYSEALNFAIENLSTIPISTRLLKMVHKILLNSTRGEAKQPGELRTSQNWIGGTGLKDARFIPPHFTDLNNLMSDLEKFTHNDSLKMPTLIKAALIHYQFETIHPFSDGNGRLGRLLIILYLVDQKILDRPSLYLSEFFEKHKSQYYESLTLVRDNNDLDQWIRFFLVGIIETSKNSKNLIRNIINLKKELEGNILHFRSKVKIASEILEFIFLHPVFTYERLATDCNLSNPTTYKYINSFIKLNILEEVTGMKKNRLYVFRRYLDLFK